VSKNIENLKALAARLAPTVWFRYLTLEWNEVFACPVAKLWNNKPKYEHGCDDYGYDWEGWQPTGDDDTFVCMINTEYLVGTSMGALPRDTEWSKLIVGKEDRE